MPQTPYRTPQDAHTDILAKIGLLDTQEAPMCGTEEYRDDSNKTIVSFDCYMISLHTLRKRNVSEHDVTPSGSQLDDNVVTSLSNKGKTVIINSYHHQKEIGEPDQRFSIPASRRKIFGSQKRKYSPEQRNRLIVEMSDTGIEYEERSRSAYRMTRAVLASMLENSGVHDVEVDFVLMSNCFSPYNPEKEVIGIALMCNNTFVTSYAFDTNDDELILLTHCIHDGGADAIQERVTVEGSTAKDIVRHLTPVLLKIVETAGE